MTMLAVVSLLTTGCLSTDENGKDNNSSDENGVPSGKVTEKSSSNDLYGEAQLIGFEDNMFSVKGSANSSDDVEDWYAFTAPEKGQYACGLKYDSGNELTIKIYQQGNYDVGGNDGGRYTYSGHIPDAGYKEVNYPASSTLAFSTINGEIAKGSKSYIRVIADTTGGNTASYTLDCFSPTVYKDAVETGDVTEDKTLMNSYHRLALPIKFDSNTSIVIHGEVNSDTDKDDYYKFTTSEAGDYNITMTGSAGIDIDLSLYNLDETTHGSFNNSNSADAQGSFTAVKNGKYYLRVNGYSTGGATAQYTVHIFKP